MGLYEGIKDIAKVMQQADNIDLYLKLLDLCEQALDMQAIINKLTEENTELRKKRDVEERIQRHQELYITLKDDEAETFYCSHCWDHDRKLIQMNKSNGEFFCYHCHLKGIYNRSEYDKYLQSHHMDIY